MSIIKDAIQKYVLASEGLEPCEIFGDFSYVCPGCNGIKRINPERLVGLDNGNVIFEERYFKGDDGILECIHYNFAREYVSKVLRQELQNHFNKVYNVLKSKR